MMQSNGTLYIDPEVMPKFPVNYFPGRFTIDCPSGTKLCFVRTSAAFPLQYDVYWRNQQCGYVRYRSGTLTVFTPDLSRELFVLQGDFLEQWQPEILTDIASKVLAAWVESKASDRYLSKAT